MSCHVMSRHGRWTSIGAPLSLALALVTTFGCSDATAPPPGDEEDGAFSVGVSGDVARSFAGRAVFAGDVPGPEYGFAVALVDSTDAGGEAVVRHAVYLHREAGGVPTVGEHAVGVAGGFRAGVVLDGEGDDPFLCVAETGTIVVEAASATAVRGSFELGAPCAHVDGAPVGTIVATGTFVAVVGGIDVPDEATELPRLEGRFVLRSAAGSPLPAPVFDGLIQVGEDEFAHLVITATGGHIELDGSGRYEHRVTQEVRVDGVPAPSLDWVDRGDCAPVGDELHCLSSLVQHRALVVAVERDALEVVQDLGGEGVAVRFRYERGQ